MANKYTTLNSLFTAIANSIRAKKNSTGTIVANMFPDEINSLKTGFDYENHMATSIADYEFKNCEDLLSVNCYNLTSIGANAFENCTNLKSVILWDSVATIGENAFNGCDNLAEIYVAWQEGEVEGAPWGADNATIYYSNAGSLGLKYSFNSVGYSVSIGECNDTDIRIPMYYKGEPVTSIGFNAFYNCTSLTSITIPNSVTNINNNAFYNCTSIISITYTGTIAQWSAIDFGRDWNYNTGAYTIHCTDGDIAKS